MQANIYIFIWLNRSSFTIEISQEDQNIFFIFVNFLAFIYVLWIYLLGCQVGKRTTIFQKS